MLQTGNALLLLIGRGLVVGALVLFVIALFAALRFSGGGNNSSG